MVTLRDRPVSGSIGTNVTGMQGISALGSMGFWRGRRLGGGGRSNGGKLFGSGLLFVHL